MALVAVVLVLRVDLRKERFDELHVGLVVEHVHRVGVAHVEFNPLDAGL